MPTANYRLCALVALRDSLRGAGTCPKLGVDWKSATEGQTGAFFDPQRTSKARVNPRAKECRGARIP